MMFVHWSKGTASCWVRFFAYQLAFQKLAIARHNRPRPLNRRMRDLLVVCTECGERFTVPLAAIDLPGETLTAIPNSDDSLHSALGAGRG